MKKNLLPLLAFAVMTSLAWGQELRHCTTSDTGGGGGTETLLFCGYDTGCYKIANDYKDDGSGACTAGSTAKGCEPCATKIANCRKDGELWKGKTPDALSADPWGAGQDCNNPSFASNFEFVKIGGRENCGDYWCKWDACEKIVPDPDGTYGDATANCAEAIANCVNNGGRYSTSTCSANSFVDGKVNPNNPAVGCCRWTGGDDPTKCWTVYADQTDDIEGCRDNGWGDWWNSACPDGNGGCPNSNPVGPGGDPNPPQQPSSNSQPPPPPSYSSDGNGNAPIIKTLSLNVSGNALTAMQNAVNLQVTGEAMLRVYDMKGKVVLARKVVKGNHNVQLQLPRGLYIVKATNGSWKQTAKVAVK